jgi:xanthine/CO dehydrogenase XdhC/CoxF family maturation factor
MLAPGDLSAVESVLRRVYSPVGLAVATPAAYLIAGGVAALIAAAVPLQRRSSRPSQPDR